MDEDHDVPGLLTHKETSEAVGVLCGITGTVDGVGPLSSYQLAVCVHYKGAHWLASALNERLSRAASRCSHAEAYARRMDVTNDELRARIRELRKQLEIDRYRAFEAERASELLQRCVACGVIVEGNPPWYIAGFGRTCCSVSCFKRACWWLFDNYISLRRETKAWQDGRAKLRLVRRYLKENLTPPKTPRASDGA